MSLPNTTQRIQPIRGLPILLAATTAEYLRTHPVLSPAFYGVADKDSTTFKHQLNIYNASTAVNAPEEGLDTPARGKVRWDHLQAFFQQNPMNLDISTMQTIISTDIDQGGVFIGGYEQQGTNTWCGDDASFGSVVLDLNDFSRLWWLRYDYATKNKTWDHIDLT